MPDETALPPPAARASPSNLAPLQLRRPALGPLDGQPTLTALLKPPLPPTTSAQAPGAPPADAATPAAPAAADKTPTPPPPQQPAPPVALPPPNGDAREPASIDALASPVAATAAAAAAEAEAPRPPDAPRPNPSTAPAPPPPLLVRDSPSHPPEPAAAASKAVSAEKAAAAQGGALPLPGAVPGTPTGEPQTRGAAPTAGGAAGAAAGDHPVSRSGKREPPKAPPPPTAIDHPSVTADGRMVEQYIPFGFVELRGKLMADFPEVFADPQVAAKFVELSKWISLRNTLRLALDYGDADEKYAPLDPDKDTLAFKAAAADESAGGGPPAPAKSLVPKSDLKAMVSDLYGELDRILDIAEFTEMPPEHLENAKKHKSLMGLEVKTAPDEYLEYRLHFRGTRTKKIQFRRWALFKRQIEMNVYERLAITFRLKKPVSDDDVPAEAASASMGIDTRPWYRRMFCGCRDPVSPALRELRDEFVYMKLFKDVMQSDVDMLLPGVVIRFTWWDHLMVWVPILVGCGMAIWKAANGTIKFDNLIDAVLSVVLIVMPITWGARAYMAVREKQRLHQAHLNALFLLHNLNNNAGVISQLLGEAQEQEDNEAMLAYFFLWRGEAFPKPAAKLDLDRAVEAYLQRKLDELKVNVRMDYEVLDSITKLERMGLVTTIKGEDGVKRLQVLPLGAAVEKSHVRHFDESREAGQPQVPPSEIKRQGNVGLTWHECVDIFRPTGQKFRYFWNAQTGESQYHEPGEPYMKLGTAAALDFEDAHGINMADPKNYDSPIHHAKTV